MVGIHPLRGLTFFWGGGVGSSHSCQVPSPQKFHGSAQRPVERRRFFFLGQGLGAQTHAWWEGVGLKGMDDSQSLLGPVQLLEPLLETSELITG